MKAKKVFYVISAISLIWLSSCAVWNAIKDRYKPYEIVGREGDKVLVKFQFYAPSASSVHLAGQFNNWTPPGATVSPDEKVNVPIPMEKDPKTGMWTVVWPLPPGRWQYKYVIDNGARWQEDPNTPEKEPDGFGGYNSVCVVQ